MKINPRRVWVPKHTLLEIESIKDEDKIANNAEAFRQMARYSQLGRKANRIGTLNFSYMGKMPTIPKPDPKHFIKPKKKPGRKKKGYVWLVEM